MTDVASTYPPGTWDHRALIERALDYSGAGILIHDRDAILYSNATLPAMIEIPAEYLRVGITIEAMWRFCAERGDYGSDFTAEQFIERNWAQNLAGISFQTERKLPSGRIIRAEIVPGKDGVTIASYTDLTELVVARRTAEAADRAKSEFLATMSHELRTPLNAIIGFSETMRNESLGPVGTSEYLEYLDFINHAGTHLLKFINDVLDVSKIEAGKLQLHEEAVDMADAVRSCVAIVRDQATRAGINLELELSADPFQLLADERKFKQILINLLTNAIKFTREGGVVRIGAWARPDTGYVIQIADTGVGIAMENIAEALTPFKQVDSELNRRYDGSGLGLPLAKSLAELHGGSLDLQSELGIGTTVTVRFPASRVIHKRSIAI